MTSEVKELFVWIWLSGNTEPVVAGKLYMDTGNCFFVYGKSYLARENAIAVYDRELPLETGEIPTVSGLELPGCIRDSSPDAWGRRVIINKLFGLKGDRVDTGTIDEFTYLLNSGSDRIGALDFQLSATDYQSRTSSDVPLEELLKSAEKIEKGIPITTELDQALLHGSSIGGARPKVLVSEKSKKYIAKFSSASDIFSFVKAEYIAMSLAGLVGLSVAPVSLEKVLDKDVLLIKRFDRIPTDKGWERRIMISALTLLGLDEMMAKYASYQDLAEIVRHRFLEPRKTLKELFSRLVFNLLSGNTDDHARNHAAFWNGKELELTPAYDICPQARTGSEASQAMLIYEQQRLSRLSICLEASREFLLTEAEALDIIRKQVEIIREYWPKVCDEAELTEIDRNFLWGRQFLNPFVFQGLENRLNI